MSLFDNDPAFTNPGPTAAERRKAAGIELRRQQLARLPVSPDYRPDPIPELCGEKRIVLNAETTGLGWSSGDRPIGWAYSLPESGRRGYLPIRHAGGNLPIEQVHGFLRSINGMHVENANLKFDLHMSREDGVDLVEQHNTFGDPAHYAALLDDHRQRFNLDQLSKDVLGWDVETTTLGKHPPSITSEAEFKLLHAEHVAPYAVRNVEQVERLIDAFEPMIVEEDLGEVLDLEQQVIPVVVEMERNGTYLDLDLLHEWRAKATQQLEDKLWFIWKNAGVKVESPDAAKSWLALFQARGIPITSRTAPSAAHPDGQPSFAEGAVKGIQDECVQAMREAGQLAGLESMFLGKYARAVRSDGWLRYNLHQLRTTRGEDDAMGTVSGRFSAAGDKHGGYNPQQVVAVEKQLERGWCPDYVVRKLFIPGPGEQCFFAADMMQVEYRLFAHYANDPSINAAYAADPLADYHAVVMMLLHTVAPTLNRKLVKNVNFAKIYGAGLIKFAFMLGLITEAQMKQLRAMQNEGDFEGTRSHPWLAEARRIMAAYDAMFPSIGPLLKRASKLAEQRGYVFTLLKRRARLRDRFNSSFNRICQGSAADWNKRVIVEAYKRRKELGLVMRLTVHDELAGGLLHGAASADALLRVLNHQYYDVRVPILWDMKTGANWAACK